MVASIRWLHYASDMRSIVLLLFLCLPGLSHAVICKIVEPDGSVTYTDVPEAECPNRVKLPDYSRYAPRDIRQQPTGTAANREQPFVGYTAFKIVSPEANGTVRSNEGKVNVAMSLEPALRPGHKIELFLDGTRIPGNFAGLGVQLSNVERGTHTLRAIVKNTEDELQIQTGSVLFTLRKASLLDPLRRPDDGGDGGDGDNPPQFPPDFEPGDSSSTPGRTNPALVPSFEPGDSSSTPGRTNPAFAPSGSGISTTPGRTNPAFAPSGSGGISTTPGRTNPAFRPGGN